MPRIFRQRTLKKIVSARRELTLLIIFVRDVWSLGLGPLLLNCRHSMFYGVFLDLRPFRLRCRLAPGATDGFIEQ